MIGFIIPFKAKSKSGNWVNDCSLLGATLKSICNQKNESYKVFVVYTDYPDVEFVNNKIHFIEFPFPFLSNEELKEEELLRNPESELVIDERMFDQGKRILFGCMHAEKERCNYVMGVDADDLVSNRIAAYVQENSSEKIGWYVNKGYILQKKFPVLLKVNRNMNYINASTHIVHVSMIPSVDFKSKNFTEFSFFSSHGYLKERIRTAIGSTLKPLPFFALIYFIHDSNWAALGTTMRKHWIKTLIKYLLFAKRLSKSVKEEFGLNK